jgi:hypothetical protein
MAFGTRARRFAAHQFIEIAFLSSRGAVLNKQRQAALLELVKPIVPGNLFQRGFATVSGEVDADHSDVLGTTGTAHAGRLAAAFFGPPPDFITIGERMG